MGGGKVLGESEGDGVEAWGKRVVLRWDRGRSSVPLAPDVVVVLAERQGEEEEEVV